MSTQKPKAQESSALSTKQDASQCQSTSSAAAISAAKSGSKENFKSAISTKNMRDLKTEHGNLKNQLNKLNREIEELDRVKLKRIKEVDNDIVEKQALLAECVELNGGGKHNKKKKKHPTPANKEGVAMPYDVESVKKLGGLAGRLIRELVGLKRMSENLHSEYVDDLCQLRQLGDLIDIWSRPGKDHRRGRTFFIKRIEELQGKIKSAESSLQVTKSKYNDNIEIGWQQATKKHEDKIKKLTAERARLQKDYLDKETRLKDVSGKTMLLNKEIAAKQSRLERQTEANKKQIFASAEFAELMNQRGVVLTRIEKAMNVIEDTKAAHDTVAAKISDVRLDIAKNQRRVEELKEKISELKVKNEEEKLTTIGTSAIMDYVSEELNAKNGLLLKIEVELEEVQNQREMLLANLKHSQIQKQTLIEESDRKEKRIAELRRDYFE